MLSSGTDPMKNFSIKFYSTYAEISQWEKQKWLCDSFDLSIPTWSKIILWILFIESGPGDNSIVTFSYSYICDDFQYISGWMKFILSIFKQAATESGFNVEVEPNYRIRAKKGWFVAFLLCLLKRAFVIFISTAFLECQCRSWLMAFRRKKATADE